MIRRLKSLLPLIFPLILTMLPFGVLYFNELQKVEVEREREATYWEQQAKNYLQLFRSQHSFEGQCSSRIVMMHSFLRRSIEEKKRIDSGYFSRVVKFFFNDGLKTEFVYAGILNKKSGKLVFFKGKNFRKQKQAVLRRVLEPLAMPLDPDSGNSFKNNKLCKSIFGPRISFDLLKSSFKGKGKPFLGKFDKIFRYSVIDSVDLSEEKALVYLFVFPRDSVDRAKRLAIGLSAFKNERKGVYPAIVPLEFADNGEKIYFGSDFPLALKGKLIELLGELKKNRFQREDDFPIGKVSNAKKMKILREFISYQVPYELWLIGDNSGPGRNRIPSFVFLILLVLGAGFVGAFSRVMIFGHPIGVSIRVWLNLLFALIGIVPLIVLYTAGAMQIETTAFRSEQLAVKDTLQMLEEADTSGNMILAEYRQVMRNFSLNPEWKKLLSSRDKADWEKASKIVEATIAKSGLTTSSFGVIPPSFSNVKDWLIIFDRWVKDRPLEIRRVNFLLPWFAKSYSMLFPEESGDVEVSLPFFSGKIGDEVIAFFLSLRSDIDVVVSENLKYFIAHDYILKNGKPYNWYFLRSKIDQVFEKYLRDKVETLQISYPDSFFSLSEIGNVDAPFILPNFKNKLSGRMYKYASKWIKQASSTGAKLVRKLDDGILVVFPCQTSGPYILSAMISFSDIRDNVRRQKYYLIIIVWLLVIPVLVLARLLTEYVVQPLKTVERGISRIAEEDFSVEVKLNRTDELGNLADAFERMRLGILERVNLGRFVSASLDAEVAQKNEDDVGMKSKFGAILCSDIRNFTTLSELHPVRDIVEMLNQHLGKMAECIQSENGMVEQFVGDAIIAAFHDDDPEKAAKKAVLAAVRMYEAHKELNIQRKLRGKFQYEFGIGIDGGKLLSGTIEAKGRREYLIIGKARNTAEQLEGLSKQGKHTKIILTESLKEMVKDEHNFVILDGSDFYELLISENNS